MRIRESLEQAFSLGGGTVEILEVRKRKSRPWLRIPVTGTTQPLHEGFDAYLFKNTFHCGDGEISIERPRPSLFSYNHPIGACPECNGFGKVLVIDPHKCVPDHSKTIANHAVDCWRGNAASGEFKRLLAFCKEQGISTTSPWASLTSEQQDIIFSHKSRAYVGITPWFKWLETKKYKMHVRVFLSRYRGQNDCASCGGSRLRSDALAYKIDGKTISEISSMPLKELVTWFSALERSLRERDRLPRQLAEVLKNIVSRLTYLVSLGLPYLSLDRQSRTLSGGETQRVNLISAVGSNLISTHFVLDEPSVGLHARDTEELIKALRDLTDRGNSVTVVEHDPDCLQAADTILELGPEAGERGGNITYYGPVESWAGLGMRPFRAADNEPSFAKKISITNARNRNLKSISLDIPLESFVCLTGVSGSGKSSLLTEVLQNAYQLHTGIVPGENTLDATVTGFEHVRQVLLIDQTPLSKTPRANIATYTKMWDRVRDLLAKTEDAEERGLSKSSFSFNVRGGRCPTCEGAGFIREDMQFLSDVFIECESCLGRRFQSTVLECRLKGKNVHEILSMTVHAAAELFEKDLLIGSVCRVLSQLGLGHITLGSLEERRKDLNLCRTLWRALVVPPSSFLTSPQQDFTFVISNGSLSCFVIFGSRDTRFCA